MITIEVKEIMPNLNKLVRYNGSTYTLTAGIVRRDKRGKIFYQAEILDKNQNSVCITRLTDIEIEAHT